ncbi:colicin V synthesis protein [[Actinobacillus] muris]|uniref:Colicin V synthesis protein n=1 Tax=Muribacter muris TaxID=67855 RepID=A0A0J5P6C5_9PAST|nr:CvpA family protein [Muribacter muris]KMK51933.1 colicin V synthesis protein [[Actinobacillus] muris] [Muribacter muris]MBF0784879.1 CvpA family protein [Muribacter muris]MBF0826498.1 CvpA family protein [Muribacter muris]TFV10952.1 colicin V synthesis protein [Muribacter muris]
MVDAIIIGIIVFSLLVSLWRGFVSEVLSLVGWVVAFFIASKFYPYLSGYLLQINSVYLQNSEYLRNGIAAAILFVITLMIVGIANALLSQLVDKTGLTGTDRVLGAAFGVLRGIFIVAAILFFIDTFTQFSQSELWKESQLIPHFDFIVKWFFEQLQANSSFLKSTN